MSAETIRPKRRSYFALLLAVVMALVAAGSLLVMRQAAAHSPKAALQPTPVLNTVQEPARVSPTLVVSALLRFVPAGDADTLGQAMCSATGTVPCSLAHYPGHVTWRQDGSRYLVVVTMTVHIRRLLAGGEIDLGHLPGASNLKTGQLAVSTNNSIYGVDMNPRTHQAVFRYYLAANDEEVWALNWNALGAVSQNSSLQ